MRALVIADFGGPEVLELRELPAPVPVTGRQVLVRVLATSVNPLDYQMRRGDYRAYVKLPAVLGCDVSGVVEAVGEAVSDFSPGDEVFYTPQLFHGAGSYADYHVATDSIIAHKPANISHFEAASLAMTGSTAWEALVTRGRLQIGESVLIHAGAGGVGCVAVQVAKAMGARVFSTCSASNRAFVEGLGADCVIDYRTQDYVEAVRRETRGKGVDLVLDTIGGDTLERSAQVLGVFGRIATVVDVSRPQALQGHWITGTTLHFIVSQPTRAKLDALRALAERGQLKPQIDSVVPLAAAGAAHARLERGGVRGKIVLDTQTPS